MARWPYNTPAWQALRVAKLAAVPTCEACRLRGVSVAANTVDHIKAVAKGGNPFPPLMGLRSLCARCHNVKTRAVDVSNGKGIAIKGAGVDGFPVDPAHPFHGEGAPKDGQPRGQDRHGYRVSTKFPGRF